MIGTAHYLTLEGEQAMRRRERVLNKAGIPRGDREEVEFRNARRIQWGTTAARVAAKGEEYSQAVGRLTGAVTVKGAELGAQDDARALAAGSASYPSPEQSRGPGPGSGPSMPYQGWGNTSATGHALGR
ncbi:hypothetical protein [Micromonospora sp. SH-82]|uniref:hypothetical protein n=1 Tax=Micromonospora sp. SH-82 TaxID=3132938 RepID=UPI003EBE66BD